MSSHEAAVPMVTQQDMEQEEDVLRAHQAAVALLSLQNNNNNNTKILLWTAYSRLRAHHVYDMVRLTRHFFHHGHASPVAMLPNTYTSAAKVISLVSHGGTPVLAHQRHLSKVVDMLEKLQEISSKVPPCVPSIMGWRYCNVTPLTHCVLITFFERINPLASNDSDVSPTTVPFIGWLLFSNGDLIQFADNYAIETSYKSIHSVKDAIGSVAWFDMVTRMGAHRLRPAPVEEYQDAVGQYLLPDMFPFNTMIKRRM